MTKLQEANHLPIAAFLRLASRFPCAGERSRNRAGIPNKKGGIGIGSRKRQSSAWVSQRLARCGKDRPKRARGGPDRGCTRPGRVRSPVGDSRYANGERASETDDA